MLYVVDARQALHFQQLFTLSRKAGYASAATSLEHVGFGVMLGDDGKPFKTRSGTTVKLVDLLEEAEERAFALVSEKNTEMPEADRKTISHAVGIGAVKYADLSKNRNSDYMFSWNSMLSFEGNTAPYLQYAYTRIQSVFRKVDVSNEQAEILLVEPAERQLALELARFADAVHAVGREGRARISCAAYLYDLAAHFMRFLRSLPGAQEQGRGARQPFASVPLDGRHAQDRLGLARHRNAGRNVKRAGRMNRNVPVIAIDGPTASGKEGTVASRTADALGWHFLDSGSIPLPPGRLAQALRSGVAFDDARVPGGDCQCAGCAL